MDTAMLAKVTIAVQKADKAFETIGGSTRHWVRECFLPALEEAGLRIVESIGEDGQWRTSRKSSDG